MEHFGKRIMHELYSYTTGLDFEHAKYFNFTSDDNEEFTIMNIYTDQAKITIAIDYNGIDILDKELYNDN